MSYEILDVNGNLVTIEKTDKILTIDGVDYDLNIDDIVPRAHYGVQDVCTEIIHPSDIVIQKIEKGNTNIIRDEDFEELVDEDGYEVEATYGDPITIEGQVRWFDAQETEQTPSGDNNSSDGHIIFDIESDTSSRQLQVRFTKRQKGTNFFV